MRPSLFANSTAGSRREIDLRESIDNILYGTNGDISHGHLVLIRNMNRTVNDSKTECSCLENHGTIEPSPTCAYCLGEGYIWSEQWRIAYSMQTSSESGFVRKYQHVAPGNVKTDYTVFFFDYRTQIREGDKIIEVLLDNEGLPIIPYVRSVIYRPETIIDFRSDNGRKEFIVAYCREFSSIRGS